MPISLIRHIHYLVYILNCTSHIVYYILQRTTTAVLYILPVYCIMHVLHIFIVASREMENQNLGRGCVLGIVVRLGDYVAVQEPLMGI